MSNQQNYSPFGKGMSLPTTIPIEALSIPLGTTMPHFSISSIPISQQMGNDNTSKEYYFLKLFLILSEKTRMIPLIKKIVVSFVLLLKIR